MIKLIKKHLKGYIFITILGPIFKLLEAIVELYLPLLVAKIINVGIKELGDINYILKYGFLMFGLYIISFIFAVICQYFAAKSAYGFGTNLRNSLYEHINSLPLYQIDKFGTPTLITRINLDIVNTQNALNRFIRLVTRSPFILVGSLIMSLTINVRLSLIFFAAAILLSIALFLIMKVSTPWLKKINLSHDEVALLTRENYAGARVVRAFNKQDQEEKEFKTASDQLKKESIALGLISALSSPITYLIINTAIIFIVYFGGFEVSNNRLKDGDIIALINYLMQILNAMLVMAMLVNLFTKASVSSKRINEIFDTPVEEKQGKEVNLCSEYALIFDNVCMAYGKNLGYSLKDITFKLKKGNTLGIIGGTGSGKTTLISLIPKLYDYEGKIDFFGSDLKELSSISVRDNIAFVPQKSVLFSGTIKDNMLMANPNASEDDMLKALELAKCDFVKSISSVVLRGGSNFSGGQRQRLCIARALIKNAPLIILDDSMSALDYTTESQIKSNLNKLKDITKIIVTQRASSIKHADLIIVLDEGKAVGIGTHSELLKTCPVYKEINDIQGGAL